MRRLFHSRAEGLISSLGLLVLAVLFARWWLVGNYANIAGHLAALVSLLLFAWGCLRFVPRWLAFWTPGERAEDREGTGPTLRSDLRFFALALLCAVGLLALLLGLRAMLGDTGSIPARLRYFLYLDTGCYLEIVEHGYAPTAAVGVRRIVFFPLYPLLVRAVMRLGVERLVAASVVSLLCAALAAVVVRRWLLLDFPPEQSRAALKYLLLLPAAFFFAVPMSESVFFLCSLMSIYLARRRRWVLAGVFGALSAFSRSLGVLVLAPLLIESIGDALAARERDPRAMLRRLGVLLVPLGTLAYMGIIYRYYGDPLYFMVAEKQYWGQRFGMFFSSAAVQIDNALADIQHPETWRNALAIWFPNVLWSLGALCLFVLTAHRLRASYAAWFIAYFFIAIAPTYLISAPRYLVAAAPVYPMLAVLAEHKTAERCLAVLSALAALAYMAAFVLYWGVW